MRRRSRPAARPPGSTAALPRERRAGTATRSAPERVDRSGRARAVDPRRPQRRYRPRAPPYPKYARAGRRCTSVCALTAILFVGDVVASTGRRVVRSMLANLRTELDADFVVVNGENASGGIGITPKHADELFNAGADVVTLGNHTYRHREVWSYLEQERRIVRPYNYLPTQPGRGACVVEKGGVSLGVINLSGLVHLQAAAPPLVAVDAALREVSAADVVLVDM